MVVITSSTINYGRIFGPLQQSLPDVVQHINKMTIDRDYSRSLNTISLDDSNISDDGDWLLDISAANNEEEQNMEVYVKDGCVYYRSLRMILKEEQLLVWYSKDLALTLGLAEISRIPKSGSLNCSICGESFVEPYPFQVHEKFTCSKNISNGRHLDQHNSMKIYELPQKRKPFDNEKMPSSLDGLSKKLKISGSNDTDRQTLTEDVEEIVGERKKEVDLNQNIAQEDKKKCNSAFKKITRPFIYSEDQNHDSSNQALTVKHIFTNNSLVSQNSQIPQFFPPVGVLNSLFPMLSSISIQKFMQYLSRDGKAVNQHSVMKNFDGRDAQSVNIYQNRPSDWNSTSVAKMNFNHMQSSCDKPQTPFIRTSNPMVDKLLQSLGPSVSHIPLSSMPVTQNWCAQCNATFRMTSDLVYHMRSHHQREFDPIKPKREDKLTCEVCHEGFRERHHLTRHMTSHM